MDSSQLDNNHFKRIEISYPPDSGAKVSLARALFSFVDPKPETLLLVDDWAVWPSSQHMPLFTRFREALGEHRPLIEAPGHLVTTSDAEDAVSIVATSLFYFFGTAMESPLPVVMRFTFRTMSFVTSRVAIALSLIEFARSFQPNKFPFAPSSLR